MTDEAQQPPPPPKPSFTDRVKASPITFGILAVNVAWFLWAEKHGSTETSPILLRFGAVEAIHVWMGEYWRVASYMFLHIGWIHLLWNSYAGFSICAAVERALGRQRFVVAYLLSGVAGGCATVITFYPAPSAGASGAMFGMIGALIALRLRQLGSLNALMADRPTRATLANAGIWLLIGTQVNFNNRAHIGGLVGGAIVTFALTSARRLGPLVAIGTGALLIVSLKPWWRPQGIELEKLRAYGGSYLLGAHGFTKDIERGERFTRRACAAGSDTDCFILAYAELAEGSDAEKQEAAELLQKECDAGKALACDVFGRRMEEAGDTARAAKLYAKACEGGMKSSCALLDSVVDAGAQ